jgi:heterodisulfide reductase subunit C
MTSGPRSAEELSKALDDKGFAYCYQCSRCTSACPTALVTPDFNPRRIILDLLHGEDIGGLEDVTIWKCVSCHSCEDACPKGVRVAGIINELRNEAFMRGKAPKAYELNVALLLKTGLVANLAGVDRARNQVGLQSPRMPDANEVNMLIEGCHLKRKEGPQ